MTDSIVERETIYWKGRACKLAEELECAYDHTRSLQAEGLRRLEKIARVEKELAKERASFDNLVSAYNNAQNTIHTLRIEAQYRAVQLEGAIAERGTIAREAFLANLAHELAALKAEMQKRDDTILYLVMRATSS